MDAYAKSIVDELAQHDAAADALEAHPWSTVIVEHADDATTLRSIGVDAVAPTDPAWLSRINLDAPVLCVDRMTRVAGDLLRLGVPETYSLWVPIPFKSVTEYMRAQLELMPDATDTEHRYFWDVAAGLAKQLVAEPLGHPGMSYSRRKVRAWKAVAEDPPIEWICRGLIPERGMVVLAGEPSAGKTLLALDAALRCAHGMQWFGRDCRPASTLYLPGEGSGGLGARLRAWDAAHPAAKAGEHFVAIADGIPDLARGDAYKQLETLVDEVERDHGRLPDMVIVDTLAMAAPGADENDAAELGRVIRVLSDLRNRRRCTVLLVHHTRKPQHGAAMGMHAVRGSSAIVGAADVVLLAGGSKNDRNLRVEKSRDGELGTPIAYDVRGQDTGKAREDGKPEYGPVVFPGEAEKRQTNEDKLAHRVEQILSTMWAMEQEGPCGSKNAVLARLEGRRSDLSAAFAEAERWELIETEGRGPKSIVRLTAKALDRFPLSVPYTCMGTDGTDSSRRFAGGGSGCDRLVPSATGNQRNRSGTGTDRGEGEGS